MYTKIEEVIKNPPRNLNWVQADNQLFAAFTGEVQYGSANLNDNEGRVIHRYYLHLNKPLSSGYVNNEGLVAKEILIQERLYPNSRNTEISRFKTWIPKQYTSFSISRETGIL